MGSPVPPCRWPFPRLRGFPQNGPHRLRLGIRCTLSASFAFLQSVKQHNLVHRPRPTDSSLGLLAPTAHEGLEVHNLRELPTLALFRPQGLATLTAAYALQARAGFVSHRQRSWGSPFGAFSSRKVSSAFRRGRAHIPFFPSVFPAAIAVGRPNGPRFLGFYPSESPWRPARD